MRSQGKLLPIVFLSIAVSAVSIAQDTGKSRGSVGGRSRGSVVGSRSSGGSTGGGGYVSGPTTSRSSPSRGSVSVNRSGGSQTVSRSGRGSGTSIPSQTYAPNYPWDWGQWNDTNWYVYRLMSQYYFLNGYNYLWRYRQGDSPLTQYSMRIALQECASASAAMLRLSDQLEGIVAEYENGELSRKDFENRVEQTTKQIRNLAKKIRKDSFLDYIDQRQKNDVASFREANSLQGLKTLTRQLRQMAFEIETGLDAFNKEDMTRVVNVRELERPSFDSLAKGIDRLAKTIDRSANRL